MSATNDSIVTDQVIVFKSILDGFVESIPKWKKLKLYEKHCKIVDKRNKQKKLMIHGREKKRKWGNKPVKVRKDYAEKVFKIDDYIRFHVLLLLIKTDHAAFIGTCTLHEIGYVLGLTRERIRQVEVVGLKKIQNPKMLLGLNKNNGIDAVIEHKELAMQRKKKKEFKSYE